MIIPKCLNQEEFLKLFDTDLHQTILQRAKELNASAVVCFECQDLGWRFALCVGPDCTYTSARACMHDLPAPKVYATAIWRLDEPEENTCSSGLGGA